MSEQQPKHEHVSGHENHAEARHGHETHKPKAEHHAEVKAHSAEDISKLRHEISKSAKESQPVKTEATQSELHTFGGQHLLKKNAYKQLLDNTRQRLPKAAQLFSKVIHNDKVEAISNIGAQTAARPSGLLGGGFGALVGSSVLLYYSRHYGFTYNYTAFFIMFAMGFAAGVVLELGFKLLFRRQKS